jgi:hypothetical protein
MSGILSLLGLGKITAIALVALTLAIPVAYLKGRWDQAASDNVQEKIDALTAANAALDKARDDAATIVLKQAEATGRERDGRIESEKRGADLEEEIRQREKELIDAKRPDCSLSDDDLGWLRQRFPEGPIGSTKPAAPAR